MAITLGTLYKRGNIWWWKYLRDGKQCAESLKTSSYAKAQERRRERLAEHDSDPAAFVRLKLDPTPDEFWKAFASWSKDHKAAGTLRVELRSWEYMLAVLHPARLSEVTPQRVELLKATLKRDGVKGRPLGDASVNQVLRQLKAVFNQGKKLGYISSANPFVGIKHYRLPVSRPDFLTAEEIENVLWAAAAHSRTIYWVCVLGIYAGLRKNEIVNARWEWFDFENKLLNVKRGPGFELKDREERAVPLSGKLADALLPFAETSGYLFNSGRKKEGRYVYRYEPKRALADVADKSSVERLGFHLLRHTFGSQHAIAGTSIYKISKWMGHSSVDVTAKHYAGLQAYDADIDKF